MAPPTVGSPSGPSPLASLGETITLPALPKAVNECLALPHVRVKNLDRTIRKIAKMIAGGPEKLIVISDFDHTISKAYDAANERLWTTHGVFHNDERFPKLSKTCQELTKKYLPIEFSKDMSMAEKVPHMEDWWRKSHEAMVAEGITRTMIEQLVAKARMYLREDGSAFFSTLEQAKVPLVVFSAGIGEVIKEFLRQRIGGVPSNVHIIANNMEFNEKGEISRFAEPLIHTFNKNGSVIEKEHAFFHDVHKRDNVILLGDSMGDLHMDVGVENHREADTLKIAFLNRKPDLLPFYLDGYDIVIVDDQTMTVPNALLKAVIGV